MKKSFVSWCWILAMVFVITACSSPSGDTGQNNHSPSQNNHSSNQEGGNKVAKDTVVLATSGEPYRFFAQSSAGCSGDDNLVLSNVYDCLLRLEGDGSISPALAEKYDLSDDGLCYTFHLLKGVKFHNGQEMTAEDVKFTYDLGFAGPIGQALFVNYDRCEIVDDYTVNIYLTSPYAAFPYGVASRLGGIASKAYYDEVGEEGYMKNPIGTGPYKFVEYTSGNNTKLTAFEDYFRGAPSVKNVVIQTVSDINTQVLGLQNGDYDVVRSPSMDVCNRLDSQEGVGWDSAFSTGRVSLYLNDWVGPCKDVNFRKAVQHAINKNDINEQMYSGYSEILNIDMCSNYSGYVTPEDGINVVEYDVDKAKEFLAKSNYNGEEFPLTVSSGSSLETAAKIIQAQLMEIGINCGVNAVDGPTYAEAWSTRSYQAYVLNNLSSLVDADGVYTAHRLDREPWGDRVFARDKEISDLLIKGRAARDQERVPIYVEACNIITEEAYDVPLVNDLSTVAFNSSLDGVKAHCLGNYFFYNWKWK